jgi:hypothetical protein
LPDRASSRSHASYSQQIAWRRASGPDQFRFGRPFAWASRSSLLIEAREPCASADWDPGHTGLKILDRIAKILIDLSGVTVSTWISHSAR